MRSIRARMTVSLLTSMLLLLMLGTLLVYISVRSWMITQFDSSLLEKAQALIGMMGDEHGRVSFELHGDFMADFQRANNPEYFQIRTVDGSLFEKSRSLAGESFPWPESAAAAPLVWDQLLPDGRDGRFMFVRSARESGEGEDGESSGEGRGEHGRLVMEAENSQLTSVRIIIARGREGLDKNLKYLLLGSLLFSAVMLLCVGLVIPLVVSKGLRPVVDMANQVKSINPDTLDNRLVSGGIPKELEEIYRNFNELLERIEKAFLREKRMTADMAHELRTPIAELRALADVSLRYPEDSEFTRETLQGALSISRHMGNIVSAMLSLARAEAGIADIEIETTDLVSVVRGEWESAMKSWKGKAIETSLELPESLSISSNPAMLKSIFRNLFENAFHYCPDQGKILCRLDIVDSDASFELENSDDTLCPGDLEEILNPFWRKESSRTDENHLGLGLSLVQALVRVLSGTIQFSLEEGNHFKSRLDLPGNSVQGKNRKV
jgi:signal transduction histidine kinase